MHLKIKFIRMRNILIAVILFTSCQAKQESIMYAFNGENIHQFDSSLSVNEFIQIIDSLECKGYVIVGNTNQKINTTNYQFIIKSKCDSPEVLKFEHTNGIKLPIYSCNGFRQNGINLCEDESLNIIKLENFYLNPNKRFDYPNNPNQATLKIVIDKSNNVTSIFEIVNQIKSLRDQINIPTLGNPIIFTIETSEQDSFELKPPTNSKKSKTEDNKRQ